MKKDIYVGKRNGNIGVITERNGCGESIYRYYNEYPGSFLQISKEDEQTLLHNVRHGDKQAENTLFKAHGKFVISIAKKLHKDRMHLSRALSLNDFIQWGNIGLLKAMQSFDTENHDCRFISYAVFIIQSVIHDEFQKAFALVRIPSNQASFVRRFMRQLSMTPQPVMQEVYSGNLDVSYCTEYDLLTKSEKSALQIPRYYHGLDDTVSLYDSTDDQLTSIERKAKELLTSEWYADAALISESLKCEITRALAMLEDREAFVITMFFGLRPRYQRITDSLAENTGEKKAYYDTVYPDGLPLSELCVILDLTLETTRQILSKALRRLGYHRYNKLLRQYL